mgnify:CR=1 FL=1
MFAHWLGVAVSSGNRIHCSAVSTLCGRLRFHTGEGGRTGNGGGTIGGTTLYSTLFKVVACFNVRILE